MALKPCPHCGNHISDKATRCPKCGIEITEGSFSKNIPPRKTEGMLPSESSEFIEEATPHRKRWLIFLLLIIIIAIPIGIVMYLNYGKTEKPDSDTQDHRRQNDRVAEQKAKELEAERLEAARLEAIRVEEERLEAERLEAERLEQLRQDSIKFEDDHRLTAEIWFSKGQTMMNKNWKTKILELGFEEGQPVNTGNVDGEYDYELYETRYIPYTRTINGRKIEIKDNQDRLIRDNVGEYHKDSQWGKDTFNGLYFSIVFEDKSDYEDFKNSLLHMGMKYNKDEGRYGFWDKLDPSIGYYKHKGETLIKFKEKNQYVVEMSERFHDC